MNVFISQPMNGRAEAEILEERNQAIFDIEAKYGENVKIIDSFFENAPNDAPPLWYLGESLKLLSAADGAIFLPGWEYERGCAIEHLCCEAYNIAVLID